MSVALVLGAGGIVGAAYHAGTLAGLLDATGWDARTADLIVGTSAGSGIGATLRAGVGPADMLGRATDPDLPAVQLPARPGLWGWPAAPRLLGSRVRPSVALAGLLPAGTVDTAIVGERIRTLYDGRRWPDEALWINAVRLSDGKLVVFGRDEEDLDVATACEASSAIPGFFRPVRIGAHDYVDGGVHSPTNADLVAGLGFDVVVVVSPMSAVRPALRQPLARMAGRRIAGAVLAREVRSVRDGGTAVLTIQPTAQDVAVMGINAMDARRRGDVAHEAFESARRRVEDPRVADVAAQLIA
jgi:NTE family protein